MWNTLTTRSHLVNQLLKILPHFRKTQIPFIRYYHYLNKNLPLSALGSTNVATHTVYKELLRPIPVPFINLTCGFKVKGHLKKRCKDCYFVVRQERLYVICKTHPRHKQMAMKKDDDKSWILTHATQSKVREY